jgi:hypothetical protein
MQSRIEVQHERVCITAQFGHDERHALGHQAGNEGDVAIVRAVAYTLTPKQIAVAPSCRRDRYHPVHLTPLPLMQLLCGLINRGALLFKAKVTRKGGCMGQTRFHFEPITNARYKQSG